MCYTGNCFYEDYLGDCGAGSLHQHTRERYGFSVCVFAAYAGNCTYGEMNPEVIEFVQKNVDLIPAMYADFKDRQELNDWDNTASPPYRFDEGRLVLGVQ